ncbi:hypothetical protein BG011_001510 [Mortierella polycephala]|uniref:NodB homology domain-containing protein n=1 Tax=Mortierella polycephala TaxID=41804 RepID=A0A9P6UAT5_9FUNG|nr:hypothetical protein BG011_001510 [Mortierella polycephala]
MLYRIALAITLLALVPLTHSSPIHIPHPLTAPQTQTQTETGHNNLFKRAPAPIITECTVPNSFAVTFDDGPGAWTHDLLDYLAKRNIKVTFFVNGENYNLITAPDMAAVVKRAFDEGHQIGSHTWSHADISTSGVDVTNEMKKLDDALLKIIGVRPVYMRPPYGNTSPASLETLASLGYKVINWNVDSNDWKHPTDFKADFEGYKTALQDPAARSKTFISLQHDAEQYTAMGFGKLAVEYVLSKGFNIMPVGTCLGDTTGWYRQ